MPFTFVTSRMVTIDGTRATDGSCGIAFTLDHAAGTPPITAVEVAENPTTCQKVFQIGTTSPSNPVATGLVTVRTPAGGSSTAGGAAAASVLQRHGYMYSYYHDPIWIVVNSIEDELTWNYDGTFITQIVAAWDEIGYLSVPLDHWYPTSHSGPVLTLAYNDTWATLVSSASFYNTDFCGGTGTSYQSNTLTALGSGSDRG